MTSLATQNPSEQIADRHAPAAEASIGVGHAGVTSGLSRLLEACWYGRSVRAQLLLTVIVIDVIAALVAGGVMIFDARTSARIEIDASMNLAEVLVRETVNLMPADTPADRFLENLPLRQRFARHVRITVRDAAGQTVTTRPMEAAPDDGRDIRSPAPAWFASLISPPIEHREMPVSVGGRRLGSVVIAGEPADEIAEVWENMTALASVAMLVNLAMIGVLYVLFGRVLDPLTSLGTGLLDLERRSFGVRLARPKARELAAITDRFNALAGALEATRAENAALYQRLITTQDDERRNTARELHDEVGPSLFGLKANAGSIVTAAAALPDAPARAVHERARDILAIVEHLQTVNRSLLTRLRPMALGHVPLTDLLADMIRERARQNPQLAFPFAAGKLQPSYGDAIDLTIYRCVQESLTNAIRHAKASNVRVNLDEAQVADATARIELAVEDDGRGIDPQTPRGFGLRGMQERVRALGGDFTLENVSGGGTRVRVAIPLPSRDGG